MESGERDRILGRSGEPLFRWRPTSVVYPLCAGDPASPNQSANRRMTDLVVTITYNTAHTHHPPAPVLLDPERRFTEGSLEQRCARGIDLFYEIFECRKQRNWTHADRIRPRGFREAGTSKRS